MNPEAIIDRFFGIARAFGHVGEFEDLPAPTDSTSAFIDRSRFAAQRVERGESRESVSLQMTGERRQLPLRMFAVAIAREIERRRRRSSAEWPVLAHMGPKTRGDGLLPGEQQHGGVVAMETLGREHMRFDQLKERPGRRGPGANMVGERRQRQIDPLAQKLLALTVERLVQPEFV